MVMVLKLGLAGGAGFKPPLCNLCPIFLFESPWNTLIGLFNSPRAGMGLQVRKSVKGMIFILDPNPTSLSF